MRVGLPVNRSSAVGCRSTCSHHYGGVNKSRNRGWSFHCNREPGMQGINVCLQEAAAGPNICQPQNLLSRVAGCQVAALFLLGSCAPVRCCRGSWQGQKGGPCSGCPLLNVSTDALRLQGPRARQFTRSAARRRHAPSPGSTAAAPAPARAARPAPPAPARCPAALPGQQQPPGRRC